MTEKPISVLVDFNNDDDSDVIRALLKRVSEPDALSIGLPVRLHDAEGNQCLGHIVALDDRSVRAKAEYDTWVPARPVRVQPTQELDAVLQERVRFSATSATSTTRELAEAS